MGSDLRAKYQTQKKEKYGEEDCVKMSQRLTASDTHLFEVILSH